MVRSHHVVPSLASAAVALAALASGAAGQIEAEPGEQLPLDPPNILIVLADDLGVDPLQRYVDELSASQPGWTGDCAFPTEQRPCLDSLQEIADHGIAFTNAWTNPSCSPTRAAILTGRYGFRTGIAKPVKPGTGVQSLCNGEDLIPELLPPVYESAAFGKWHLTRAEIPNDPGAEGYPWDNGFDYFEGRLHAVPVEDSYCVPPGSWLEVRGDPVNGGAEYPPEYGDMIEEQIRDAIDWIGTAEEPWFCYLAPQAPFEWHQWPAEEALTGCTEVQATCGKLDDDDTTEDKRDAFDARLEYADQLLGELLDLLDAQAASRSANLRWWNTTTIIFVGDNGTPNSVAREPFEPVGAMTKAKETLYEGGVRVPILIAGRKVHPSRWTTFSDELVNSVDVFATVYDLAQATASTNTIDGVSLRGYLKANPSTGLRDFLYAEYWEVATPTPCYAGNGAVDRVYLKVIDDVPWKMHYSHTNQSARRFYDLSSDPCEKGGGLTWTQVPIDVRVQLMDGVLALLSSTCDAQCP